MLMCAHHGVIVVGPTVAEAFDDLYYLERAAKLQILAMSTGAPLVHVRPEVVTQFTAEMHKDGNKRRWATLHFEALKRELMRSEAGAIFCD